MGFTGFPTSEFCCLSSILEILSPSFSEYCLLTILSNFSFWKSNKIYTTPIYYIPIKVNLTFTFSNSLILCSTFYVIFNSIFLFINFILLVSNMLFKISIEFLTNLLNLTQSEFLIYVIISISRNSMQVFYMFLVSFYSCILSQIDMLFKHIKHYLIFLYDNTTNFLHVWFWKFSFKMTFSSLLLWLFCHFF